MEKAFDLGFVYKNHEKKHKSKPAHIESVAGGVAKRRESNLKHRKSCRLTVFDNARNLPRCASPCASEPIDDMQSKIEHRKKQLEKWKEQKEKRIKDAATQKKKPFVVGVVSATLKYVPPPPPKPMPSTSGRVTRSQSAKLTTQPKGESKAKAATKSFAPKNAQFKPPQFKNATFLPLNSLQFGKKEASKVTVTFDPVIPKKVNNSTKILKDTVHQTESVSRTKRSTRQVVKPNEKATNVKVTKASPKKTRKTAMKTVESSSESSTELPSVQAAIPNKRRLSRRSQHKLEQELEKENVSIPQKQTPRKSLVAASKSSDSQESATNASTARNSEITSKRRTSRRKSVPSQNVTPKVVVPRSESSSEEKLRSPKDVMIMSTPDSGHNISPFVTVSRGKVNARKEMKKKLDEGLLDEDGSDSDSVDYFRKQLESENQRMTAMCELWDEVNNKTVLPEFVQELVLGATGQARLLMSSKMRQFSSLVQRCDSRDLNSGPLVTPADLRGFWDMIFIQIENIDMRFKYLETLKEKNWVADQPKPEKRKVAASRPKVKVTKPVAGNSRIREMIEAARKAKKAQQDTSASTLSATSATSLTSTSESEKTFEAGFFSVTSPVRSPLPATPRNKATLLKSVLSSEASKFSGSAKKSSFAMLRASLLSKNVDMDGVALLEQTPTKQLSPIDYEATPARSILKPTNVKSARKSGKKSIKTVLFDQYEDNAPEVAKDKHCTDSGLSSMDMDESTKENWPGSKRKSKLMRQEATEISPVMNRSRRNGVVTPKTDGEVDTKKRNARRKKVLQEIEAAAKNIDIDINVSRKSNVSDDVPFFTPRRSTRNSKMVDDLIDFNSPVPVKVTPKRSARIRGKKQIEV